MRISDGEMLQMGQLTQRTVGATDTVTINASYVRISDAPRFPWVGTQANLQLPMLFGQNQAPLS